MTEHIQESTIQSTKVPYQLSWIDRLVVWIDHLPGPAWLFYVLSVLVIALLSLAVFWIDGGLRPGSIDSLIAANGIIVIYWLALYQYLTRIGSRSLRSFRPLLDADDSEIARIDYELATLPRRLGWLAIPLGIGVALMDVLSSPARYGDIVLQTALPTAFDVVVSGFLISTFFCLVIRSIRQLRMVRKLHAQATNINLLKLEPAHAFSVLTARTGMGVILVLIFGFLLDPSEILGTSFDFFVSVATAILAVAIFTIPVMGMRDHIEEEKNRVLNETSDLLQSASDDLHSKVSRRAYDAFGGIEDSIGALIRERELFERIPTWPWNTGTIRGFASTLLLPIFLWLVIRLLERLF
jgi:hypothetical protein